MTKRVPPNGLISAVYHQVYTGPGRTEIELTRALFGEKMLYSRVNVQLRKLMDTGQIYRVGKGGRSDPYRYFSKANEPNSDAG